MKALILTEVNICLLAILWNALSSSGTERNSGVLKNNVIEQGKSEILLLDLQLQREYVKLF
jgi:hypothetical protein